MKHSTLMAAAAALALTAWPLAANAQAAAAQTPVPADILARMEHVAEAAVIGSTCEQLGYRFDGQAAGAMADKLTAEATAKGVSAETVEAAGEAMIASRVGPIQATTTAMAKAEGAEAYKAMAVKFIDEVASRCAKIAADPQTSAVISAPAGLDLAATRTAALDALMEARDRPSWQTKAVIDGGNFVYTLGACSPQLDAKVVASLSQTYIGDGRTAAKPTPEQRYYIDGFDEGMKDGKTAPPEAKLCAEFTKMTAAGR